MIKVDTETQRVDTINTLVAQLGQDDGAQGLESVEQFTLDT